MKTRFEVFLRTATTCTLLFILSLGSGVAHAGGAAKPCTMQEAKKAEESIDSSLDWSGVYKLYKNFSHCDDASIAEGYSDVISRLLSDKWNNVNQLNRLVSRDRGFERFVLKHVDELMSPDQSRKIRNNAVGRCPYRSGRLCKAILDRLGEVDKVIEDSSEN